MSYLSRLGSKFSFFFVENEDKKQSNRRKAKNENANENSFETDETLTWSNTSKNEMCCNWKAGLSSLPADKTYTLPALRQKEMQSS